MKHKITEREIKAIANGEANIKDLFPDVFEIKLEVGKVYKNIKTLFKCTSIIDGKPYGYGFGTSGNFYNNNTSWGYEFLKEATQKEWEEALIKEAEKRGYKQNTIIIDIYNGKKPNDTCYVSSNWFDYEEIGAGIHYGKMALRDSDGNIIFFNGFWAEIIQIISKQQAENKLKEFGFDCKIV